MDFLLVQEACVPMLYHSYLRKYSDGLSELDAYRVAIAADRIRDDNYSTGMTLAA